MWKLSWLSATLHNFSGARPRGSDAIRSMNPAPSPLSLADFQWPEDILALIKHERFRELVSAQARLRDVVAAHTPTASKMAVWMAENLPQGLGIFAFPTISTGCAPATRWNAST
jgi:hypothetical protein